MFRIYHSNALDVLKDLLVELIRREPLHDPFARETILVQSPGMAQWLKLELAQAQGIAAGIEFPLPASFLWKSFSELLPQVPVRSAFNKEAMSWKLMVLLPELLTLPEFAVLKRYLSDDEGGFKRYQLCSRIADIFDQYLVYRPDWIADWEQGGATAALAQPWQPLLWRALVTHTAGLGQSHWHRGNMFSAFVDGLKRGGSAGMLPERLFVFGISALPDNYLEALSALGQRIDVHLMVMNPCRYYWGDILDQSQIARLDRRWFDKPGVEPSHYFEQGNPLLASMGKLGRDYLVQLQALQAPEVDAFADIDRDSLLHQLQADILLLEDSSRLPAGADQLLDSDYKRPVADDDRSVCLHSCHSPLREVEVLHDQLLALFAADDTLSPRDIIVMMPDVATYAPYVDAVFGNAPSERYIPFSISDRAAPQENPLLQSVLRFIGLAESRITVSEVLELLEVPAVMRRFGIDQDGFHRIRHWVADVNVRWGLSSEQRTRWEMPAFEQNSWLFGLQRMLAGYAMGAQDQLWSGIAPYAEVEGLEGDLLGRLANFVDLLAASIERFSGDAAPGEWCERINWLLGDAYEADADDEIALDQVREVLRQLAEQTADAAYNGTLSIEILRHYLADGLNRVRSGQRFMVGAVNFCTLMPMRSIPFRIVCLLGMNDGDYPRSLPPMGFDLMADQPRRGDRSRRDDDRYLFMEALLSARDQLYISYVGRSIQDNSEKVPSVLVSELIDYLAQGYVMASHRGLDLLASAKALRRALTTEHPLAAFSAAYFDPQSRLFSYAAQWLTAAAAEPAAAPGFFGKALAAEREEGAAEVLELGDLLRFYRNPCEMFFKRRLRVFFETRESGAQDDEPFALEGLDDYLLKQRYLDAALAEQPLHVVDAQVAAEGLLPLGQGGRQALNKLRHDCEELAQKLSVLMEGDTRRREIRLPLENTMLVGWQDGWYGDTLLRYRPAQVNGRDRLLGWIEHLVACSAFTGVRATLHRGLSHRIDFKPLPVEQARAHLQTLVALYQKGMTEPLPFDPAVAWAYLSELPKGEDRARAAAQSRFEGGYNQHGAVTDPYLSRAYPTYSSLEPGLIALVDTTMTPMLAALEEHKDD